LIPDKFQSGVERMLMSYYRILKIRNNYLNNYYILIIIVNVLEIIWM